MKQHAFAAAMMSVAVVGVLLAAPASHAAPIIYDADNFSIADINVFGVDKNLNYDTYVNNDIQMGQPVAGVATDGQNVYFSRANSIYEFSAAGQYKSSFTAGSTTQFGALSFANGSLYAVENNGVDTGTFKIGVTDILRFNSNLTPVNSPFLDAYGLSGPITGLATSHGDIYFDRSNTLYKYADNGSYLGQYTDPYSSTPFGSLSFSGETLYAVLNIGVDLGGGLSAGEAIILDFNSDLAPEAGKFFEAPYDLTGSITALTSTSDAVYFSRGGTIYEYSAGGQYVQQGTPLEFAKVAALAAVPAAAAVTPGAVPEPASWMMMLGGFGLMGFVLRRRRLHSSYVY